MWVSWTWQIHTDQPDAGALLVVVPLPEDAMARAHSEVTLLLGMLGSDIEGMIVRLVTWLVADVINPGMPKHGHLRSSFPPSHRPTDR